MSDCGLANLASCMPQKFLEYFSIAINSNTEPLVKMVYLLLTQPVNVHLFYSLWAIMVYVISLFYGLFFLFSGVNFIVSGYDSAKRERAKEWLRNIILMIICVQASYVIYAVIIELESLLTTGVMNLIDPNFFMLTVDNIVNFFFQFFGSLIYMIILYGTMFMLSLRYLFVMSGVILFPFGIFFYFIPPLQSYGKLILNVIITAIFITFFDAIILLVASQLMYVGIYSYFKIFVVTTAFLAVNLMMTGVIIFAVIKAAFGVLNSDIGRNVKSAVKYFV